MEHSTNRPRLPIIAPTGFSLTHENTLSLLPTLAWIGPYEVRKRHIEERNRTLTAYVVLCPSELRKPTKYNYTAFVVRGDLLAPYDKDVELDPYHMCLLYQLITGADDG